MKKIKFEKELNINIFKNRKIVYESNRVLFFSCEEFDNTKINHITKLYNVAIFPVFNRMLINEDFNIKENRRYGAFIKKGYSGHISFKKIDDNYSIFYFLIFSDEAIKKTISKIIEFMSHDNLIKDSFYYKYFDINNKILRKIYMLEYDSKFSKSFSHIDFLIKECEILNLMLSLNISDTIMYSFLSNEDLKVVKLKHFMENNYLQKWDVSDFSKESGYSISTFKSLFFNVYGQQPKKWIKLKRLNDAKNTLLDKKKSISDVAQELNFSDSSHFINSFKEVYKITPSEYRKTFKI